MSIYAFTYSIPFSVKQLWSIFKTLLSKNFPLISGFRSCSSPISCERILIVMDFSGHNCRIKMAIEGFLVVKQLRKKLVQITFENHLKQASLSLGKTKFSAKASQI